MASRTQITITVGTVSETFPCVTASEFADIYAATGIKFESGPRASDSATYTVNSTQSGPTNVSKQITKLYGSVNGQTKLIYEAQQ